jgi:hypothetical protein
MLYDRRVAIVPRQYCRLFLAACVLAVGALLAVRATPASADHGLETVCSNGWITEAGECKYVQAKDGTACVDQACTKIKIKTVSWRGGTASGTCDPSNDQTAWRLVSVKIVRASDGHVNWSFGPGAWKTNCDVTANTYSKSPAFTVSADNWVMFKWQFNSATGVQTYYHVGLLVSPR